jgi:hypothetical protein
MEKITRLTESDLTRLVRRVIEEQTTMDDSCLKKMGFKFYPKSGNSMRQGPYGNIPAYYKDKYQGNDAMFYMNGKLRIMGGKTTNNPSGMEKRGEWKCESGKLNVFNLSEWKRAMPS